MFVGSGVCVRVCVHVRVCVCCFFLCHCQLNSDINPGQAITREEGNFQGGAAEGDAALTSSCTPPSVSLSTLTHTSIEFPAFGLPKDCE